MIHPFGEVTGSDVMGSEPPIIIAAPQAVKGKRQVGTSDGVQVLDEKVFAKMAITEKWKIEGVAKVLGSDADTAKEVKKLVEQMRDGKSADRKAARDKLIELGDSVLMELKKYESDSDPEVKESVKDMIERLR